MKKLNPSKSHAASINCPTCQGPLVPRVLVCEPCDLKIEASFTQNEFASLSAEDLHFLRIFIFCEGKIRDMERALGVSYPTIKSKIAGLKATLRMADDKQTVKSEPSEEQAPLTTMELLGAIEKGQLTFKEAMSRLAATNH